MERVERSRGEGESRGVSRYTAFARQATLRRGQEDYWCDGVTGLQQAIQDNATTERASGTLIH
ncbi:hypothetical protein [Alcanivorax nanhaiticus]|uniref:hypothetical protein n=1 Tax=Alcanivorax nanhaiticus TaxID=1177154 RepID=UPI0012E0249E|nr:hypothetical protein [Alcanivorax nanhaiticus]